jgi:hypothetical protein
MSAKIGDEKWCRTIDWNIDGKIVARNFCIILGDDAMINAFAGNIENIYKKV